MKLTDGEATAIATYLLRGQRTAEAPQNIPGLAYEYCNATAPGAAGANTSPWWAGPTWATRAACPRTSTVPTRSCVPRPSRPSFGAARSPGSTGPVTSDSAFRGWALRVTPIWTGRVPFEIKEMRAKPDGFELTFTRPVDAASVEAPGARNMRTHTYIYQSTCGSPEVDKTTPAVEGIAVSPDGLSALVTVEGLVEGCVHELHCPGIKSAEGAPLLHM